MRRSRYLIVFLALGSCSKLAEPNEAVLPGPFAGAHLSGFRSLERW